MCYLHVVVGALRRDAERCRTTLLRCAGGRRSISAGGRPGRLGHPLAELGRLQRLGSGAQGEEPAHGVLQPLEDERGRKPAAYAAAMDLESRVALVTGGGGAG